MQFIDTALINVYAGNGGNGVISFRREKFVPKGGPDGGNGGRGGDVVIVVDKQLNTLLDFQYKRNYKAPHGAPGWGKKQEGKSGKPIVLRVPPGTLIRDGVSGKLIADLTIAGQSVVIAKGGKGGRGNSEFATPSNRAPRIAEPGQPGEERTIRLELKLLADVGLVGFPNAGKSTLIASISAAKPKIADYPFTTLVPNLGMVFVEMGKSFTVADIPGLIEGASEGKGLGIQFLRHIERTSLLCFLIEATSDDPVRDYKVLLGELKKYDPKLARRKKIVVVSKCDLADAAALKKLPHLSFGRGVKAHLISAVVGAGLKELKSIFWSFVIAKRAR